MKPKSNPIINLESFRTVVLLKKLKEEDPAWLPEDELFYQKMEKNIMLSIQHRERESSSSSITQSTASPKMAAPKIEILPLAMASRSFQPNRK